MLEVLARIRHRRTRRQLSPYLDGMLSARETRRLEEHLAQCQACCDEMAELQATVEALAELPLVEAPRSFALAAAPAPVFRPAARRAEFGLRLATAAAAFALAVVLVGDFTGLPGGEEGEAPAVVRMERQALPTGTGGLQGALAATPQPEPDQSTAEDKMVTEPTPPPAGAGDIGQEAPSPPAYYSEDAPGTATPEPPISVTPGVSPEGPYPAVGEGATPVATAPPATAPGPETPALTVTPVPERTPAASALAGSPEAASPPATSGTPAATATPVPVGAEIAPSEPEQQTPAEADEQALAGAERETLAAEEGGPSRETVVRWLEVGLATGAVLLFVSWILARRRGWA